MNHHANSENGSGSSISAVRTERTAHPGPSSRVSACQEYLEPVSGFEPLTVRLQGELPSPRKSTTGCLISLAASSPGFGLHGQRHPSTAVVSSVLARPESLPIPDLPLWRLFHGRHQTASWSGPVCSSSGYRTMSPISAPFWHATGTGDASRCELSPRGLGRRTPLSSGRVGVQVVGNLRSYFFMSRCIRSRWFSTARSNIPSGSDQFVSRGSPSRCSCGGMASIQPNAPCRQRSRMLAPASVGQ